MRLRWPAWATASPGSSPASSPPFASRMDTSKETLLLRRSCRNISGSPPASGTRMIPACQLPISLPVPISRPVRMLPKSNCTVAVPTSFYRRTLILIVSVHSAPHPTRTFVAETASETLTGSSGALSRPTTATWIVSATTKTYTMPFAAIGKTSSAQLLSFKTFSSFTRKNCIPRASRTCLKRTEFSCSTTAI